MFVSRNLEKLALRVKRIIRYYTTTEDTMNTPIVTVTEGKLKGTTEKLLDGSSYYSFKGIPYGQPPIGELRFKAPLPVKPWDGVLNATEHGPNCPQFDITSNQLIEGNEDCLHLNVYTKTLEEKAKVPVMVYIHGGAYSSGSGDSITYGPEFLFLHDVILVTINYRLEVLGFLALDIPEVPGNAGMKDQVLALRWVKRNIAKFGGDPDNVTIFGESAGAGSATFHMLSPLSQGLFNKVIAQSGVCINDWAFARDARERAFRLGSYLGKETSNAKELLDFLRTVPAVKLTKANLTTRTDDEKYRGLPLHFGPVVEKIFKDVDGFINEEPVDMVLANKVAKVPLIIGYNSAEGIFMLHDQIKKGPFYSKHPSYFVPSEIARKVSRDKMQEFGERIKKFYFGDKDITGDLAEAIVDLQTDLHFSYNTHRFLQFYSSTDQPIYMYKFDLDSDLNAVKLSLGCSNMKGAAHADDIFYLFCNFFNKDTYKDSEELRKIVFRLTKLWTDFARTGNPTPDNSIGIKWPQYTKTGKEYLNISRNLTVGLYSERDRVEFWNKLYCDAGVPCITKSSL